VVVVVVVLVRVLVLGQTSPLLTQRPIPDVPAVLLPSFPISGVPPFDKTAASTVSEEVRTPEGVGWGGVGGGWVHGAGMLDPLEEEMEDGLGSVDGLPMGLKRRLWF
jgi:hypothetical protein